MATWRQRESCRLTFDERYKRVPWHHEGWWIGSVGDKDHYAHVSCDDPSKLAYTPNGEYGEQDRQIRVRPGRYLKKFFGDGLLTKEIQYWADKWAEFNEDHELLVAMEPDDIEHVYVHGPHSCMSDMDGFECSRHPARVYGAGDLGVAYIANGGHIKARTLVWPEKLVHNTIYGDIFRLRSALSGKNYHADQGLEFIGAKLLKIPGPTDRSWVGPYIDGNYAVEEAGRHLIICRSGIRGIHAHTTNGLFGGWKCERCEEGASEDEALCIGDVGEMWCEDCWGNHSFYCNTCNQQCSLSNMNSLEDEEEIYCDECWSEHTSACDRCETRVGNNNLYRVSGNSWCESCQSDHAFACDKCGDWEDRDDQYNGVGGDSWCNHCKTHNAFECKGCEGAWSTESRFEDEHGDEYCEACFADLKLEEANA